MGLLESLGIKNQLDAADKEFSDILSDDTLNESFVISADGSLGINSPVNLNQGIQEGNFIGDSFYDTGGVFGRAYNNPGMQEIEKGYIIQQRAIAVQPDVAIGIEEIMKDLYDKSDPLSLEVILPDGYKEEDELIKDVYKSFAEFKKKPFTVIGNNQTPILLLFFNLLKQTYIDGHLIVYACKVPIAPEMPVKNQLQNINSNLYGNMNPYAGLQGYGTDKAGRLGSRTQWYAPSQSLVHGFMFESQTPPEENKDYFNIENLKTQDIDILLENLHEIENKKFKNEHALEATPNNAVTKLKDNEKLIFIPLDPSRITWINNLPNYDLIKGNKIPLNIDMVISADFGLFDAVGARYGFLQYAFKYANQLQSLQDMLVPMRFRRSVARRIFNVDVGNLPQARATEYMLETQRKFKYKKTYDIKNGKIVQGDSEPVGIVEDYWFANRAGSKGTSVEMLDEAGNFADSLEDILYFNKKLYQSMFIPLRRVFQTEAEYDYTSNSIEVDEMRFNAFLDRMRFVFNSVFTKMFQIYINQTTDFNEELQESLEVTLRYDNWFEQNKRFEQFKNALDLYESAKENVGKAYSAETMIKTVFNMTPDEVQAEFNKIKSELEPDSIYYPLFAAVAADAEDGGSDY